MDKLIEVSAKNMNKVFSESLCCPDDIYKFWCIANMFPTVDAEEVVRCKDCKHWGDQDGKLQNSDGELFARCKAHNYLIDGRHTGWCPSENDFCSYAERKDGDWNGA